KKYQKSLYEAKILFNRIHYLEYGHALLDKILNKSDAYVLRQENLLKMLLVDLMIRDKDPIASTEWFSHIAFSKMAKCYELCTRSMQTMKQRKKVPLSEKEIFYKLITSSKDVPEKLQTLISRIVSEARLSNPCFTHILGYLRLYF